MAVHPLRPQAIGIQHPDGRFLQAPDVGVKVAVGWPENRVDHKLSRAMVCGPTATVCREYANPRLAQRRRSGQDIVFASATTNGDHRRMLEHEQCIADRP